MIPRLSQLDTIIFDLGEVIVDLDPKSVIAEFSRLSKGKGDLLRELLVSSPHLFEYETGRMTDQEFIRAANALIAGEIPEQDFRRAWNLLIRDVPKHRLELLEKLSATHRVLLLSNTNKMHELYFDSLVGQVSGKQMKDYAHTAYYSHEIGFRKPNRDIYEFVIDQQNLDPKRAIFLDDRPENVSAAMQTGLHAVQVMFPDQIFEILANE